MIFMGGGGGAKDYVCARTSQAQSRCPVRLGSRALEALRVFDALSCYLSLAI